MKTSTETLLEALEAKNDKRLDWVIIRARNNKYNEYLSNETFPLSLLINDLQGISKEDFKDLVTRVISGDFDATSEEAEQWIKSDEGQSTLTKIAQNK